MDRQYRRSSRSRNGVSVSRKTRRPRPLAKRENCGNLRPRPLPKHGQTAPDAVPFATSSRVHCRKSALRTTRPLDPPLGEASWVYLDRRDFVGGADAGYRSCRKSPAVTDRSETLDEPAPPPSHL